MKVIASQDRSGTMRPRDANFDNRFEVEAFDAARNEPGSVLL